MTEALDQAKSDLRRRMRERIKEVSKRELEQAAISAVAILQEQTAWRRAKTVLFYSALPGELDLQAALDAALEQGKQVALPRFAGNSQYEACLVKGRRDICPGKFGAGEAASWCSKISLNRLDLLLVPGLAFDSRGRRLGRGKGFYDRLLAEMAGQKCGVALDQQLASDVPIAPHDILMNYLLTPTRWMTV